VAMRIPHDTWVLDEGNDPAVKAMCERLGAKHFSRKEQLEYQTDHGVFERKTKHGNYNAWLDAEGYERYDVIVGFDPDHVPYADFLEASLGYLEDSKIGYVQLPQIYYNQRSGFVARGAAEETYSYYSTTQMASYAFGFPIVTGCHQVHRTTALKEVGGFAAHDADDLLITFLYRAAGWQGVYVPEIHAKGLTPTDWPSYLKQQLRWASSVIDVKVRAFPRLAPDLPLHTRFMGMLHGFYYVQEGVFGFVMTVFVLFSLATGFAPAFLTKVGLSQMGMNLPLLMLTDFYRQRFFLDFKSEFGVHLRASFLRFVKWPYIVLGVIDGITGKKRPYSITSKVKAEGKRATVMKPHLFILALGICAWLIGRLHDAETNTAVLFAAGTTALMTGLALWSERWHYPEPYTESLLRAELPQVFGPPAPEALPPAPAPERG
jgi:cellulose synthase (UDP-forming)